MTSRLTVMPFLLAFFAAVAAMPTNVYQVCAWDAGTLEIEPWHQRTGAAVRSALSKFRTLFAALWTPQVAAAAVVLVLCAIIAAQTADAHGVLIATVPVIGLQARRATLLTEAEGLKQADGKFADDAARTAFDAKMTEIESLDAQIRAAHATPPAAQPPPADVATAERARITGIQEAVRLSKIPNGETFAADIVTRGVPLDQARTALFAKMAEQSAATVIDATRVEMGEDARDKWVRGAGNWLLVRSGMAEMITKFERTTADKVDPGEFRGLSLMDLAKEALKRHGVETRGMDRMRIAGEAMAYRSNYQSISDFATLLENTMHKVLRASYAITPDTWSLFCGTASVVDFRTHNWYRTGALTVLDDLNAAGEFQNKSIPDGEKATYSVGTKGNIIGVNRQVIVNDDLGFVMRLTSMLGRAGKLTIEKMVYTSLNLNSGLGPTQADAQPLFHANRSNVNASASAITMAGIEADRVVMASQLDPNGQDYLDLRPSVLLVPIGKGGDAKTINDAQFDPADSKFQKPNIVRGVFSKIVDTPRISGTRRYLFADPSNAPVFMVSFLEGQQEPVLESQDGWRYDGVEMKARLDVGVTTVDYRGAVTNAGA